MNLTSKQLDVILFVVGPTLFVLGLFSFSHVEATGDNSIAIAYVYKKTALLALAGGTALIGLGAVLRSWAKSS